MSIETRLADLGITLPAAAAPVASYVPFVEANGLLHISGQISFAEDGSLITGRLGEDMDLEAGQAAARRCGIMLLAQMKNALGSLDFLYHHLITDVFGGKRYFDFGISNEKQGTRLNEGLIFWKESYGASAIVQDFYAIDTSAHRALNQVLI